MQLSRRATLVAAVLALAAAPALAHHGWGSYDAANPITITAPIKHVVYENPHVHVMVDHQGKAWEITLAPPFRMMNRGALAEILKVGRAITAYGYASREKQAEMRAERITVEGKTYEMR